jgi:hypothetical protein
MTILDRISDLDLGLAYGEEVLAEVPDPADLDEIAVRLPEQDWCAVCALDETSEPGMPRDVVSRSVEQPTQLPGDWNFTGEPGPLYDVTWLSCGHSIAQLLAPQWSGPLS